MTQDIRLVALLRAKPGQADALEAILKACVAPSRAEAGCREYTLHRELGNTDQFVFVETWVDQAAIDFHKGTAHYQAMAQASANLLLERNLVLMEPVAGQ